MKLQADPSDLKRLLRNLKRTAPEISREIARENRMVGERIQDEARQRMAGLAPGGHVASVGASGIVHRAFPDQIQLKLASSNPFVRALEFGTKVHFVFGRPMLASAMRRRVFAPHHPDGYALRPTVEANRTKAAEAMLDAAIRGLNRAL